ncbi:mitochondrial ribosomal subunit S27-domain-containing protein [Gongronella butleri]|nr:mitochondrial ribosomal subunit S27-domain-containing protein [Gongronella butleri]
MSAAAPSAARLAQLAQLRSSVFGTVYNPTASRTGNKILRQRLVGPVMTQYNPKQLAHFRDLKALYPELDLINVEEKKRLDEIAQRKRRGKGAPKKGQGKRASNKKK